MALYIKQSSQWKLIDKTYIKNNENWVELNDTELPNYINSNLKAKKEYIWKKYNNYDSHVKALITFNDTSYKDIINNVFPTITGTPSLVKGKILNAAAFPADDSHYIDIEIPNLTTIMNTNQWTFDWWEYGLGFNQDSAVFVLGSHGKYTMLSSYAYTSSSGKRRKYFYASSTGSSWDLAVYQKMGDYLDNQWVHKAIVRNGTSIKLFSDGILITEITSSDLIKTYNNNIRFSYCWGGLGMNGYLDEFRFSDIPRWSENFSVPISPDESNFTSYVFNESINAYPEDGFADDGYYYKRL